jgi:hypothetical protein
LLLVLSLTGAGCSRGHDAEAMASAAPSPAEEAPAPPARAVATVQRVGSRKDVPLGGPRVEAKPGDWLLQGPGGVAVVSAAKGTIVDFGADGGDDALVALDPTVFIGLDEMTSVVESVGPAGPGEHAVLVKRRILSDPALRLWTYVTFADHALRIESVATAQDEPALAVTLGEVVAWGNVPTWVEGLGFAGEKGSFAGDFIAREGLDVSYALAPEEGHIVARFKHPEPGFHEWARTGERVESIPAHGASKRRVVTMTQARGALGEAVRTLPRYAREAPDTWAVPTGLPPGAFAEVQSCAGSPFARFDLTGAELRVPRGNCTLRIAALGHAPGAWVRASASKSAPLPEAGWLHWQVRDGDGAVLPARILVRGIAGTSDPDWGEVPSEGAALDVIHADRDGQRELPPGRYRVTVTRGFEYTLREQDVTVTPGGTSVVDVRLERVVDTRGWISADLHVHAVPSPDAPTPLADRVRTLAAAGVEVAVSTDHNVITDYSSTIQETGLGPWLASIVGDEVTTRGVPLGHYNVFPLLAGSPPVEFDHVTPPALVAAARSAPPADRPKVVQLNHPRIGSIGYFELLHFDPRDVSAWKASSTLAETGFDAIEVFNGDHYAEIAEVERVMHDWYALLNAGVRTTATGNSDSHKATYHECGVPRNLVLVGDDDPARFDGAHEARFVDAVRAGHVVVSSGPVVRIEVAGKGPGDTAAAGTDEVHVTVDAPPWVDVSRVELVKQGETVRSWTGPFTKSTRRLDARLDISLAKGDWLLAVARGDQPMTFLARPGAKPFAFTNPVWIE